MAKVEIKMGEIGGGGSKTYEHYGTLSNSRIECGFRPRIIMIYDAHYSSYDYLDAVLYNSDISSSTYTFQLNGMLYSNVTVGGSNTQLGGVDSTGFDLPYYSYYSSSTQIIAME